MKSDFLPVKKTKKLPVKEKKGVKNLKNWPKSGREKRKQPVKKIKKRPKIAFMGTFHGKKTLVCRTFGNNKGCHLVTRPKTSFCKLYDVSFQV